MTLWHIVYEGHWKPCNQKVTVILHNCWSSKAAGTNGRGSHALPESLSSADSYFPKKILWDICFSLQSVPWKKGPGLGWILRRKCVWWTRITMTRAAWYGQNTSIAIVLLHIAIAVPFKILVGSYHHFSEIKKKSLQPKLLKQISNQLFWGNKPHTLCLLIQPSRLYSHPFMLKF